MILVLTTQCNANAVYVQHSLQLYFKINVTKHVVNAQYTCGTPELLPAWDVSNFFYWYNNIHHLEFEKMMTVIIDQMLLWSYIVVHVS
jgi:hypothetical protein